MPSPDEILAGLSQIANDASALAVAWHALALVALLALAPGWRPSRRQLGLLLTLPLLSVSALAWTHGNPFNGAVFAAGAVALAVLSARWRDRQPPGGAPLWARLAGAALLAFGWVYPHFVAVDSPLSYLYAAPLGLVPCPTLSAVVGATLLAGGLGSRAWSLLLGALGLLYGLFGGLRLGVAIDLVLIAGAAALLTLALLTRPAAAAHEPAPRPAGGA